MWQHSAFSHHCTFLFSFNLGLHHLSKLECICSAKLSIQTTQQTSSDVLLAGFMFVIWALFCQTWVSLDTSHSANLMWCLKLFREKAPSNWKLIVLNWKLIVLCSNFLVIYCGIEHYKDDRPLLLLTFLSVNWFQYILIMDFAIG